MSARPLPAPGALAVVPEGELARRLETTRGRMLAGGLPAYDDGFILADVRLAPPRRFNEFSGDLSGRWIGAMAVGAVGEPSWERIDRVVRDAIGCQRGDGRFGAEGLDFSPAAIGREHMALLWGNGRLLVGLVEYHLRRPSPEVLAAARRLGDFCRRVHRLCAGTDVGQRLRDQGAFGWICLTQLSEGLALLARATGEQAYGDVAVELLDALGSRRGVHSHGWLSTLRGVLVAAEDRGDRALVARVAALVDEVLESGDCVACGGVLEYFGIDTTRADITAHSGAHPRDEGCSEADLVRLCVQLWRLTGCEAYLRRAEDAFVNHLLANQFPSGDFGHRVLSSSGFKPTDNVARAWWCCTPHGLRCARDVLDAAVVAEADGWRVDLALDCAWSDARGGGRLAWSAPDRIEVSSTVDAVVALRQPDWGRFSAAGAADEGGFLRLRLRRGETATVAVAHRLRLLARVDAQAGGGPVEAAVRLGPWLLAVDDLAEPAFFGEPWGGNRLHWDGWRLEPDGSVRVAYEHEGFAGRHPLTLRPVGRTGGAGIVGWWLRHATLPAEATR